MARPYPISVKWELFPRTSLWPAVVNLSNFSWLKQSIEPLPLIRRAFAQYASSPVASSAAHISVEVNLRQSESITGAVFDSAACIALNSSVSFVIKEKGLSTESSGWI